MEHKPLDDIRQVADLRTEPPRTPMTRRERLARWAELLEGDPQRRLKTLEEIELVPKAERYQMRADGSPLTVAFEDPVLRREGLGSDRLGDAIAFFELTDRQVHRVLCSCLNGRTMESGIAGQRVRAIADSRVDPVLIAAAAAVGLCALPILAHVFG